MSDYEVERKEEMRGIGGIGGIAEILAIVARQQKPAEKPVHTRGNG
jgi:hypothetical protein